MKISNTKNFSSTALVELFSSVNWLGSTNPAVLQSAMLHSTRVFSAWDGDKLVGLIRSMDDDCYSANIDCLLVHRDYQKQGIATQLLNRLLEDLKSVEFVSVSPNLRSNFGLYQNVGFEEVRTGGLLQLDWCKYNEIIEAKEADA